MSSACASAIATDGKSVLDYLHHAILFVLGNLPLSRLPLSPRLLIFLHTRPTWEVVIGSILSGLSTYVLILILRHVPPVSLNHDEYNPLLLLRREVRVRIKS